MVRPQNKTKTTRLTVSGLADRWGVSVDSIYKGLANGSIPHIRVGKRYVIPTAAIERAEANAGQREAVGA